MYIQSSSAEELVEKSELATRFSLVGNNVQHFSGSSCYDPPTKDSNTSEAVN